MRTGRDRLDDRIRATHGALVRAADLLARAATEGKLRGGISPDFLRRLEDQKASLKGQLATRASSGSPADDEGRLAADWGEFVGARTAADGAIRQCLALVSGAAFRSLDLDDGTCAIADTLIVEINDQARVRWDGFTIMAADDEFVPADEIVRVRFPPGDVWSLAAAAHEFGHFATGRLDAPGSGLSRIQVFDAYMQELDEDRRRTAGSPSAGLTPLERRHQAEFFADAFATYAAGPAFACTALLARFDPFAAGTATPTRANAVGSANPGSHPSDLQRAHVILEVLGKVAATHFTRFSGIRGRLAAQWQAAVAETGLRQDRPPDADVLTGMANRFWTILKTSREALQYAGWDSAQAMQNDLLEADAPPPADARVLDVLNSAWSARLEGREVSDRAWSWCQTLAQRRASVQTRSPRG
jgi:hypothetical protein